MEHIKKFSWCEDYGMKFLNVNITDSVITIKDSYKVKKTKHMKEVIEWLKSYDTSVGQRSRFSLMCEWKTHNLLYWMGIEKERTSNCDLNNESVLRKVLYFIGSLIYFGQ